MTPRKLNQSTKIDSYLSNYEFCIHIIMQKSQMLADLDKINLYIVLGLSSNNVIESLILEGYNSSDVYFYIFDNYEQLSLTHPFIHKTLKYLISLYKKQYFMEPNLNNFRNLVDNSDEFGKNFIKVLDYSNSSVITACSYYQKNRKVIGLKPTETINQSTINNVIKETIKPKSTIGLKSETGQLKSKIALKQKIQVS
jgi:hypothetical protein